MEVNIQAINFTASSTLDEFINKKADRLLRRNPDITVFDITMRVVKFEAPGNKEANVKVEIPGLVQLIAHKTADSFEECVDSWIDAIEHQTEKKKKEGK